MDTRTPKEYSLNVYSDLPTVKEVIKAILHTIFFHRFFPPVRPYTFDVLDLTISAAADVELRALVDARVNAVAQQYLSIAAETPRSAGGAASGGSGVGGVRGQIAVEFFERRRKRAGGMGVWFPGFAGTGERGEREREEEVCWERWVLEVTVATPRTEAERLKVRQAMERSLRKATMDVLTCVNRDKEHIPIIVNESNPFPYQIILNPQSANWTNRLGLS